MNNPIISTLLPVPGANLKKHALLPSKPRENQRSGRLRLSVQFSSVLKQIKKSVKTSKERDISSAILYTTFLYRDKMLYGKNQQK